MPATRIIGEVFCETLPRAPTADGLHKLQNRRVEMTYRSGFGPEGLT